MGFRDECVARLSETAHSWNPKACKQWNPKISEPTQKKQIKAVPEAQNSKTSLTLSKTQLPTETEYRGTQVWAGPNKAETGYLQLVPFRVQGLQQGCYKGSVKIYII